MYIYCTMTTAIYLRVSTWDQSTESQEADLERWEQASGETAKRYVDHFTGTSMKRPGMDEMLADMRAGKIQRIVVWRLDRLGRTASGATALFDELTALGVTLVSLKEGIDLGTPAGRLMASMLASFAQYETEVRRERQMAGIAVAKKKGVFRGRKPGSTEVKNGPRKARKLADRGMTASEISTILHCSVRTVWNYLKAEPSRDELVEDGA